MTKATFVNENNNKLKSTSVASGQKLTSRVLSRTAGNLGIAAISNGAGLNLSSVIEAIDKQIEDIDKSTKIEESISKAITDLSAIQQVSAIKDLVKSILTKFGICKNEKEAEKMMEEEGSEIGEATVDYVDSTITALPETVNNSRYGEIAGRLHGIFRSATENILENSGEGNLYTAVAAISANSLSDELENITDDIEKVETGINTAFGKVNKLFSIIKTRRGNIKEVADIFNTLPNDCQNIKSQVLDMQRLSRTTGFSDYRANSVLDKVSSILRGFPDLKIEKADSRNKYDDISNICNQIQNKINQANQTTDNLINLKNNFMNMAKETKPTNAEFTGVYKDIDKLAKSANSFVSLVKSGDSRARNAYNETKYQLNRILVGLSRFQKYSKNNNADKMMSKLSKADAKIGKFLSKLDNNVMTPLETVSNCITTVDYVAKFANNTANKLTYLFYNPDKVEGSDIARLETVSRIMENRAVKACTSAMNAINPAAATVRSFSPKIDEATQVYVETVKQTSSSAMNAIKNADMSTFSGIVQDFTQITLGGQVASKLFSYIENNKSLLTISEISDISSLVNMFKAREKQELTVHSQINVAEQREETLGRNEEFKRELEGQKDKAKELANKYG